MLKIQHPPSLYTVSAVFGCIILVRYLAIPAIGLLSAATTYTGMCHGFTDSSSSCSWTTYAINESFWVMLLLTVPNLFFGFLFGAIFSFAFFRSVWQRQVITTSNNEWLPLFLGGGIALLCGLISAIIVIAIPSSIVTFFSTLGLH